MDQDNKPNISNLNEVSEWIDELSGLKDYSPVSMDEWIRMKPKIYRYPDCEKNIAKIGFDNTVLDNAIIKILRADPDLKKDYKDPEIEQAKKEIAEEMAKNFSYLVKNKNFDAENDITGVSVVDMNSAISTPIQTSITPQINPTEAKTEVNNLFNDSPSFKIGEKVKIKLNKETGEIIGLLGNDIYKVKTDNDEGTFLGTDLDKTDNNFSNIGQFSPDLPEYISKDIGVTRDVVNRIIEEVNELKGSNTGISDIQNYICKKYNIPIDSDKTSYSTSNLIQDNIKKDNRALGADPDRISVKKINIALQKTPQVSSLLAKLSDPSKGFIYNSIFKTFDSPAIVVNKIKEQLAKEGIALSSEDIISFIKNIPSQNIHIPEDYMFSRGDNLGIVTSVFNSHKLGLSANSAKIFYDSFLSSSLNEEKAAELLVQLCQQEGRNILPDTAKDIVRHLKETLQKMRATDGHIVFSEGNKEIKGKNNMLIKNFSEIKEALADLIAMSAELGIDEKFILEHGDELLNILFNSEEQGAKIIKIASIFYNNGLESSKETAADLAEEFLDSFKTSNLAEQKLAKKETQAEMDKKLAKSMFTRGINKREIAMKLHKSLNDIDLLLEEGKENFQDNFSLGSFGTDLINNRGGVEGGTFDKAKRIMTVLTALGVGASFIIANINHIKNALKLKDKNISKEQIADILNQDARYKKNADRMASAFISRMSHNALDASLSAARNVNPQSPNHSFSRRTFQIIL